MQEFPPLYKHDCPKCIFLGRHFSADKKEADLYYCANEPTIIARWSDEPSDYGSGLPFAFGEMFRKHSPEYFDAYTRACMMGIISGATKAYFELAYGSQDILSKLSTLVWKQKDPQLAEQFFDLKDTLELAQKELHTRMNK